MLPDVPWLRPDAFIHWHFAMIASRNRRSSLVMSCYLSRSAWVERRLAGEITANLLRRLFGGNGDSAHGRACDVRRQRDIGQPQQRPVGWRGFDGEGVEHRSGELRRGERIVQRLVVDQRTPRGID